MIEELNTFEVEEIKKLAKEKIGACQKSYDIIGTQIFSILSLYARVIYYPLGENAPWGFTRITGQSPQTSQSKPFVTINTSIPIYNQVFAAAHELYHIWYENEPDYLPTNLLDEIGKNKSEKKANRFAAEFLVDETLLRQEMSLFGIKKISIKSILILSDIFQVPFRSMIKRLFEINSISPKQKDNFLSISESDILKYRKRYGISIGVPDERIVLDNLVDLSVRAFEKNLISYERLEYLLSQSHLTPNDVGIHYAIQDCFTPSENDLDEIMGEAE